MLQTPFDRTSLTGFAPTSASAIARLSPRVLIASSPHSITATVSGYAPPVLRPVLLQDVVRDRGAALPRGRAGHSVGVERVDVSPGWEDPGAVAQQVAADRGQDVLAWGKERWRALDFKRGELDCPSSKKRSIWVFAVL